MVSFTMKSIARRNIIAHGIAAAGIIIVPKVLAGEIQAANQPVFQFNGVDYYFRWSNSKQYEFTPVEQSDLDKYSDMFTVVAAPDNTAEGLAAWANATLDMYKSKGAILKGSSVPATPHKPAEHFIAAMLRGNGVIEGIFARFVLLDGVGYSLVYVRRGYGAGAGASVGKWVTANGAKTEAALMKFAPVPTVDLLKKWRKAALVR